MVGKVEKWYNAIEIHFCAIVMILMLVILSLEIIMRFFFGQTLGWSNELARYMLVWLAYMSASIAVIRKAHIKIDLVLNLWPINWRIYLHFISNTIFFAYCIIVVYLSSILISQLHATGSISLGTGVPMWIIYISMPLSHFLMAIRILQNQIELIKDKAKDSKVDENFSC